MNKIIALNKKELSFVIGGYNMRSIFCNAILLEANAILIMSAITSAKAIIKNENILDIPFFVITNIGAFVITNLGKNNIMKFIQWYDALGASAATTKVLYDWNVDVDVVKLGNGNEYSMKI
jgi:hypothetical protein